MFGVPERDCPPGSTSSTRPNLGFTWCGMAVWDRSGDLTTDCLHYHFMYYVTPPGSEVWDFHIPKAGLTVRWSSRLKTYQFDYDKDGLQAQLEWSAFHPPSARKSPTHGPTGARGTTTTMLGRMTGELVLQGERMRVLLCCRDRSWGPHRKDKLARGSYMWGVAGEDHAFIGYVLNLNRSNDTESRFSESSERRSIHSGAMEGPVHSKQRNIRPCQHSRFRTHISRCL